MATKRKTTKKHEGKRKVCTGTGEKKRCRWIPVSHKTRKPKKTAEPSCGCGG